MGPRMKNRDRRLTLVFLLAAGPEQASVGSVLRLAQAALDAGHGVSRHVMDAWTPITACASNAAARGIAETELVAGARRGVGALGGGVHAV